MIESVTREPPLQQRCESQATRTLGPLCPPGPVKPREPAPQPLPSGSHLWLEQLCSGSCLHLSPTPRPGQLAWLLPYLDRWGPRWVSLPCLLPQEVVHFSLGT